MRPPSPHPPAEENTAIRKRTGLSALKSATKAALLGAACSALAACSLGEGWKDVPHPEQPVWELDWKPVAGTLNAIWSSSDGQVWAVGNDGLILHTHDAGKNWEAQASSTKQSLDRLGGRRDASLVWATSGPDLLLLSHDRGGTWAIRHPTVFLFALAAGASGAIWGIANPDGTNGQILKSNDDGTTWMPIKTVAASLSAITASDDGSQIWAVGEAGMIVHSEDSGTTWKTETIGFSDLWNVYASHDGAYALAATSDGTLLRFGADEKQWKPTLAAGGFGFPSICESNGSRDLWAGGSSSFETTPALWRSQDGGKTWIQVEQRQGVQSAFALTGAQSGLDLWRLSDQGTIARSTDGKSWTPQLVGPPESLTGIFATGDGSRLWLAGGKGDIASSSDGGTSWHAEATGLPAPISWIGGTADGAHLRALSADGSFLQRYGSPAQWLKKKIADKIRAVHAAGDATSLWAVGDRLVAHSADGGETWQMTPLTSGGEKPTEIDESVGICVTPDGNNVWALTAAARLFHSQDGGKSWVRRTPGSAARGLFCSPRQGGSDLWILTKHEIYHSADGGATWTSQYSGLDSLLSIFGASEGSFLWVSSESGALLESADRGRSWKAKLFRSPLLDLSFRRQIVRVVASPDLRRAWAVKQSTVYQASTSKRYPEITAVRLMKFPLGKARLELRLVHEKAAPCRDLKGSMNVLERGKPVEVSDKLLALPESRYTCAFKFSASELRLRPGDRLQMEVSLDDGDYRRVLPLPELAFDPWGWFKDNKEWLIPAAAVGSLLAACLVLLLVRPLGLLALYRWVKIYTLVDHLELNAAIKSLLNVTILPLFVKHPRTLDAWVADSRERIERRFEAEETVRQCGAYVPLPLRIGDVAAGTLIEKPEPALLSEWFSPKRSLLQVVGPGGAGKTTLAVEIARWALAGKKRGGLERWPMLPVLVDEDTTDLVAVVTRKLRSWLDEELDGEFLDALLSKQRLLVIFDRLSERQQATQDHVRTIHGKHRVNALLLTARYPLDFEAGGAAAIHPEPLASESLLFFMTSLLQAPEHRGIFPTMESQLDLGRKLARLIRVGGREVPLTPLLVKLYVSKAIELARRPGGEEELPKSIPDVYFDYLRGVNPQGHAVINRVADEEMLQVAELLGRQALEDDFVPKDFPKSSARKRLAAQGFGGPGKPDAIQRLLDNGVLLERRIGPDEFLRFLLDPVAEFLAAMSWARDCAGSPEQWHDLRDQLAARGKQASGFATALALVCEAYAHLYGWPCETPSGGKPADTVVPSSSTPPSIDSTPGAK